MVLPHIKYRPYSYHTTPSGYEIPDDMGINFKRRQLWMKWQDLRLPIPNEVSGSTGLLRRASKHLERKNGSG